MLDSMPTELIEYLTNNPNDLGVEYKIINRNKNNYISYRWQCYDTNSINPLFVSGDYLNTNTSIYYRGYIPTGHSYSKLEYGDETDFPFIIVKNSVSSDNQIMRINIF